MWLTWRTCDLYAEPYDPQRPVGFDETSTQLLAETRPSLPPRPGCGRTTSTAGRVPATCSWPVVDGLAAGGGDPAAHHARLRPSDAVAGAPGDPGGASWLNNRPASLRDVRLPSGWSSTIPPSSWLNMAEIEFSVLSRSCLKQRLPDQEALQREVQAR